MLELFSKHSLMDLTVKTTGDIEVDEHHTVRYRHSIGYGYERSGKRRRLADTDLHPFPWTTLTNVTWIWGRPYTVFICPWRQSGDGLRDGGGRNRICNRCQYPCKCTVRSQTSHWKSIFSTCQSLRQAVH